MDKAILLDFGSTYTKAAVADLKQREIVFTTKAPSTVFSDARRGLATCYDQIRAEIGEKEFENAAKLATSSAAGGLRMAVVGLTPTLSVIAGKNAAFGAGAKILKICSGRISEEDVCQLESMDLEILLICGGYEDGKVTTVLYNVERIAASACRMPVIYAGNSRLQRQVRLLFQQAGKECFLVENIIPDVDVIASTPTEELIRNIFLDRIANGKGLDKIRKEIDRLVMPTPASVLAAGELLSLGTKEQKGLGALAIVDIGGATTDIHSYCYPLGAQGAKIVGTPEPYAKRTVEGDLGMRESSNLVLEAAGYEAAARDLDMQVDELRASIDKRLDDIKFLPTDDAESREKELKIDQRIARYAANIAMRRHVGYIEAVTSKICPYLQHGKNLEEVRTVIGTGGPIVNSENPAEILGEVFKTDRDRKLMKLLPDSGRTFIDADYVLYAAGMLREIDPEAAFAIMMNSLREVRK